jgi:hypothetical protein
VADHRPAEHLVEDLRFVGFETRTFTGGEYDGLEIHKSSGAAEQRSGEAAKQRSSQAAERKTTVIGTTF